GTAGSDHRNADAGCDPAGQLQVKAALLSVPIHAGKQNLPGSPFHHFLRPVHRPSIGGSAASVNVYDPVVSPGIPSGIDGHHDALAAETARPLLHQFRTEN